MTELLKEKLIAKVMVLNEMLWEHRLAEPDISDWQSNFQGKVLSQSEEQLHALYLLTHLTYFGLREVRELLRCMYRDYVRAPILRELRAANPDLLTVADFAPLVEAEVKRTRFVGMGNPAESGTHLLYYFRQEAKLPKDLFVHTHQLFDGDITGTEAKFADPDLRRIVFVDDVCGSGQQSIDYSRILLRQIRDVATRTAQHVDISYLVLLGSRAGIERARIHSSFDTIECVSEMDESFKVYSSDSRVFASPPPEITKEKSRQVADHYGRSLCPPHPLGYANSQLLLALHHNVPDNTLPIIWTEGGALRWKPLMRREMKIY